MLSSKVIRQENHITFPWNTLEFTNRRCDFPCLIFSNRHRKEPCGSKGGRPSTTFLLKGLFTTNPIPCVTWVSLRAAPLISPLKLSQNIQEICCFLPQSTKGSSQTATCSQNKIPIQPLTEASGALCFASRAQRALRGAEVTACRFYRNSCGK